MVILLSQVTHAQIAGESVLTVNEIPRSGLLLNSGWIFHPDDHPAYATNNSKSFNSIPVNPTLVLAELPVVQNSGIGWFCLNMQIAPALRNKTIGIMLSLFGAAEIYLNGERIYRFGVVSANYKQEKTQAIYGKPFTITLGNQERQLLAVRYSINPSNIYIKTGVVPPCIRIVLQPLNETIDDYSVLVKHAYEYVSVALTIELAALVLTLFFFFSFPARKEYLYFGLYFCFNFLAVLIQSDLAGVGKLVQLSVNQLGFIQVFIYLLLITGSLFNLNAMYVLLHKKPTLYNRFLLWYSIICMAALPFLPRWAGFFPDLVFPLICFELLPTYYKAARRNFKGGWILFTSILLSFIFLIGLIKVSIAKDAATIMALTSLTMLTPALGIVIFLAGDFARTSLALKSRVAEVEMLSQKTIAQERDKQELLAAQKDKLELEVQLRTSQLRKSLAELKSTQKQLIQSEKMALLGELTTGVAHEIQNPLNFVNNFSEVSVELVEEQKELIKNGLKEEAMMMADEVKENLKKVVYHGKRADAIVKGMLEHGKGAKGEKQPTDINALADEYLRLSSRAFTAKDPLFEVAIETAFDESINKIEVVPQDIGRVLLNIYNNALYEVHQKWKVADHLLAKQPSNYKPFVFIQTKNLVDNIEIIVKDNGNGVPENIIDKIYQPFFTTKPAGEGTGLGLSLTYDIVKAHGGDVRLETHEGEGSTFIITLPKASG